MISFKLTLIELTESRREVLSGRFTLRICFTNDLVLIRAAALVLYALAYYNLVNIIIKNVIGG